MTMPAEAAKNNVEIGKKDILNQQLRIARQRELMAKLERLRQLGGVCRDPPRLIPRQQLPIRPLLQHARPLPDGQPNPRPVLDGGGKNGLRFTQIVARIEQIFDLHAVADPLLDLVVISVVRKERIVGFFVGRRCALRHIHRNPAGHLDSQFAD